MVIKVNTQKGFTLLELMIVVAIIGTLAAMAYPMYKNSTLKSQVTVANTEISALRTNIDLCLIDGKTLPADLLKPTDADCDVGATKSALLQGGAPVATFTATDKGAGTLIGTFGGNAQAILKDTTITWTRDLQGAWTCKTNFTTENTLAPFIPNNCKDAK